MTEPCAKFRLSAGVSRRAILSGLAGTTALLALPAGLWAHVPASSPVFRHGVASGDPDATSVVLWTRVTHQGAAEVAWELAETAAFDPVLRRGIAATGPERDHTVKVLAEGLAPGRTYYYRFRLGDAWSPVGRTRTLPQGRLDRLGIALASCSNYAFGFFNAYDAIARDADVDFVLHTGDYIYEYGADEWGGPVAHTIDRVHAPANEIVSLADYRTRHAQYKTDAGSRAMHAAHPLLACWDDHESANDPWIGGAENHQPAKEGDWAARRAASIQAYYEWMPIREPAPGRTRAQFWRGYSFGDLATLHTLETLHTARARQIDYLAHATTITSKDAAAKFRRDVLGEPGRRLLAPELEADLEVALAASVKAGQPWRLIGNPMVIARCDVPDLAALGLVPDPYPALATATLADLARAAESPATILAWKGHWNLPFYPDTWDGYPWARERLYALSRRVGAGDLVFLSGDSHSFWANRLKDDAGRPAGIEIGTAGISSPGDFIDSGFAPDTARKLDAAFAEHVPEIVWTDNMHQGYVRIELERERGLASFIGVDTVLSPDYRTFTIRRAPFARQGASVDFT
ncbi:alkaline phosphatase D family protein [Novosphingobium album (ex Liu et al. 2023)]|uniref:Alkaline phosphatase D family protein n=1 Tax=Novosphingobium album (ex Liu et al. 2023) TaxID=3031130 RepID=A0ABT5WSA0_9SPHN|nr:alkaline phosphatase D family protein [Novosphingobium album (ex Liu et al. 2023)]MDE8652908.1 alkaline phosphatase D family protein [Novosphingobium album (ex Liu et al. 2023)]